MNATDGPTTPESFEAEPPGVRYRTAGRGEAYALAVWAILGGAFMAHILHYGPDLWDGPHALAVIGGLVLSVVLFHLIRARTRTVRPRYFNRVEALSAVWLGVGGGIAAQVLGDGRGVPVGAAALASLVLIFPLLACSMWLAVRGR